MKTIFFLSFFFLTSAVFAANQPAVAEAPSPFRVPPGFVVEKVAGPPLVEHPMMAGFDERGRLFVAESAGKNLQAEDLRKQLPNFIRVLQPADATGHFRQSAIFADKMTFPMGALWYRGALFTGSSGALWRLEDTQGIGSADVRRELVAKFGYTGNAADIHGPFLGPDGRIYWCEGRHGHEISRPDGPTLRGKAARIFRCRPDGSGVEVVCGGGMDNPVEIAFTPEGEPLATANIFHNQPARNDAIIFGIEGGNFPWHDVYHEFPRTGPLLPAIADLGWVAPSGLMICRSDEWRVTSDKESKKDNDFSGHSSLSTRHCFFSTQFNRNRIQKHVLQREGASFRMKTEDFLVSSDRNFHPTDVLQDADGSLLVIDTGGWFRIGCPTSKIAQPDIKGAIYRIRKADGPKLSDPRGLEIAWNRLAVTDLIGLLDDPRFMVRDRAIDQLALKGAEVLVPLKNCLTTSTSSRQVRNAVWALTRMEDAEARALVRLVINDRDLSVRLAALHSIGLHRDARALPQLMALVVKDQPAVRRQAATALGRIGDPKAIPALMEALGQKETAGDRFLEHALIYALIRIDHPEAVTRYLQDTLPSVRRAALIALDQMPVYETLYLGKEVKAEYLGREMVTPLLQTSDPSLLQAVLGVIAGRPSWGKEITGLLRAWLNDPNPEAARLESLRSMITGLGTDPAIQELTSQTLREQKISPEVRLLLLEVMARAPLAKLPASWLKELGRALEHAEEKVVQQAMACIRARNLTDFDPALLQLAANPARSVALKVAALTAVAPRLPRLNAVQFALLLGELAEKNPPLDKLAAAGVLGQVPLEEGQLLSLADRLAGAGPLELPRLLAAFEKSTQGAVGEKMIRALGQSPGLSSLPPTTLARAFQGFPADIRQKARELEKRLAVDTAQQHARLTELEPLLAGGEKERGRNVFFSPKASCAACHAVENKGTAIGPDLSKIGAVRSGRDLLESVVFPSASFARGFESYLVETTNGKVYTGILARETADALFLINADRTEIRIPRGEIDSFTPARTSIMPQGLDVQLSAEELRDLLTFLQGLR